jgi:hypothetical protein
MLKLSDYIGQVLTDVATGREIADKNSAALSERYQADGFMKGMPVPHYTIDQASFELPFMIVGVVTKGTMDDGIVDEIQEITKTKTAFLLQSFLYEHYQKTHILSNSESEVSSASIKKKYKTNVDSVVTKLCKTLAIAIEEEGLKIIKLLDLVDTICARLSELLEKEFAQEGEDNPFADQEAIRALCEKYRRILFNEYKDIISTTNGVIVDASTGKLNEYAEDSCLTHLKLTLREQDLDFIVEQDEKSGAMKRFLSLN